MVSPRLASRLMIVLFVVGVGLRVGQYLANPAMWVDELMLSENIVRLSPRNLLTRPLEYTQVAPRGFLLVEKIAVSSLGPSDYSLRLFPLLGSLMALWLFWRTAERVLDGWAPAIALGMFAVAPPLIAFSSQVKQYSTDVFVAVLLLLIAIDLNSQDITPRRAVWAGAIGAVVVWFSQPAVFLLLGLSASLAFGAYRKHREMKRSDPRPVAGLVLAWTAAAAAATAAGLRSMTAEAFDYMRTFWAAGLLPIPVSSAFKTAWPLGQIKELIGVGGPASLGYKLPLLFVVLAAVGGWILWRRRRGVGALLLAPVGVTLLAAVARRYPFSDRLILFLVPTFLLAVAASIDWIRQVISPVSRPVGLMACLVLVAPALYSTATRRPVYEAENVKPVLAYVQSRRQPGDVVYVYYGAATAVQFYASRYGLADGSYLIGGCHRGDGRRYLEELDSFRGRARVWLIVTHALPVYGEQGDMLRYLDAIGNRRESLTVPANFVGNWGLPADAFLFNLSDPERLAHAAAASFPLAGPSSLLSAYTC